MKNYIFLVAMIFLAGCDQSAGENKISVEKPQQQSSSLVTTITTDTIAINTYQQTHSSWYALPQYFNGVPKYSGAMGTYTAKHSPVAVSCSLGKWATYSENFDGDLSIYSLNLVTGSKYLIHTVAGFDDPHQNAAIQCGGGKLWVTVGSRGDKRLGYQYSSTDGINWTLYATGYRAYPQLHWVNDHLITVYSSYEHQTDGSIIRRPMTSCGNYPLTSDGIGHYMISYYDGNYIHMIYNDLWPDGTYGAADNRIHLKYMKSVDGCVWTSPVNWYDGTEFIYLKDFTSINGVPTALVVKSDSVDPNYGNREVWKITANSQIFVRKTNHNYTTGALMKNSGGIMWPDGDTKYAGGRFMGREYVNYIRRVHGDDDLFIAAEGISGEFDSDSWIITVRM